MSNPPKNESGRIGDPAGFSKIELREFCRIINRFPISAQLSSGLRPNERKR
jgi:alkylhydroperoxidase family enzyme